MGNVCVASSVKVDRLKSFFSGRKIKDVEYNNGIISLIFEDELPSIAIIVDETQIPTNELPTR